MLNVGERQCKCFFKTSLKRKPQDNFHSTTVDLPVDRPKLSHAPQPRTTFLNSAVQHGQKILLTKRMVIAQLRDSARHDEKFPLVKCIVIAKAARRKAA
jgi:hypothetical protein